MLFVDIVTDTKYRVCFQGWLLPTLGIPMPPPPTHPIRGIARVLLKLVLSGAGLGSFVFLALGYFGAGLRCFGENMNLTADVENCRRCAQAAACPLSAFIVCVGLDWTGYLDSGDSLFL